MKGLTVLVLPQLKKKNLWYSTVQYSTVQYSTVQYSTVQYKEPVSEGHHPACQHQGRHQADHWGQRSQISSSFL